MQYDQNEIIEWLFHRHAWFCFMRGTDPSDQRLSEGKGCQSEPNIAEDLAHD
jgi:hypothetical protein